MQRLQISHDSLTIQKFELRNPCTFSFLHIIIVRNCNDISTLSNKCGASHQKKIQGGFQFIIVRVHSGFTILTLVSHF